MQDVNLDNLNYKIESFIVIVFLIDLDYFDLLKYFILYILLCLLRNFGINYIQ
jgi:hypothetical protein